MQIGTITEIEHLPKQYWLHRFHCFDWERWDNGWGWAVRWLPIVLFLAQVAYVFNARQGAALIDVFPPKNTTAQAMLPRSWADFRNLWADIRNCRIAIVTNDIVPVRRESKYAKANNFLKKYSQFIFFIFACLWLIHLYQWGRWLRGFLGFSSIEWPKFVRHDHRYFITASDLDNKEQSGFSFTCKEELEIVPGCILAADTEGIFIFEANSHSKIGGNTDKNFEKRALELFKRHPQSPYYQKEQREIAQKRQEEEALAAQLSVIDNLRRLNFSGDLFAITRQPYGGRLGAGFSPWTEYYIGIVDVIPVTHWNGAISHNYYLYKMDGMRIDPIYSWGCLDIGYSTQYPTVQTNHLVGVVLSGKGHFNIGAVCDYNTGETWLPGLKKAKYVEEVVRLEKQNRHFVEAETEFRNDCLIQVVQIMRQHRDDLLFGNPQDQPHV